MGKPSCGHCNWHDEIKQNKVYCLFYDQWIDKNFPCENFVEYSYLNREERSRRASEARIKIEAKKREEKERQEAEKRAQEGQRHAEEIAHLNRKHAKKLLQMRMKLDRKMWWQTLWWQFLLAFISSGLGFVVGRLTMP